MPEYLTPGVYLEETSFRSRSIEGVATSTFGMAGLDDVRPGALRADEPERGDGAEPDRWSPASPSSSARSAASSRSVQRPDRTTWPTRPARSSPTADDGSTSRGSSRSRVDGAGADRRVANFARARRSAPAASRPGGPGGPARPATRSASGSASAAARTSWSAARLGGSLPGAAVETIADRTAVPSDTTVPVANNVQVVAVDPATNELAFVDVAGAFTPIVDDGVSGLCHLTLTVDVRMGDPHRQSTPGSSSTRGTPGRSAQVLQAERPADELGLVWLDENGPAGTTVGDLLVAMLAMTPLPTDWVFLSGATDGAGSPRPTSSGGTSDPDDASTGRDRAGRPGRDRGHRHRGHAGRRRPG